MPDVFHSPIPPAPPTKPAHVDPSKNYLKIQKSITPFGFRQALSPFLYKPERMRFETQEEGEFIYLLLRRHWVTNVGWVLLGIILFVLPTFLFPYLLITGILPQSFTLNYLGISFFIWYLITFTYVFSNFLLWYFNVVIITNERVIDIDFINLMNKKLSETRISHVEDVTTKTGGIMKAFFNYGDVIIQTAAHEVEFYFNAVPMPDRVVEVLNQIIESEEAEHEVNPK